MGDVAKEIDYIACQLLLTWQQSSKTFPFYVVIITQSANNIKNNSRLGSWRDKNRKKKLG